MVRTGRKARFADSRLRGELCSPPLSAHRHTRQIVRCHKSRQACCTLNMTTSPSPNSNPLLDAQAVLRLALPISLLVILVGRWSFRAFIAMAERLQSQGWQPDEDDDYEPVPSAAANGDGEDDIQPVVVKIKTQRRRLILALFWLLGASFAADGVAQSQWRLGAMVCALFPLTVYTPQSSTH